MKIRHMASILVAHYVLAALEQSMSHPPYI